MSERGKIKEDKWLREREREKKGGSRWKEKEMKKDARWQCEKETKKMRLGNKAEKERETR